MFKLLDAFNTSTRLWVRFLVILLLALTRVAVAATSASANVVQPLAALASPDAWQARDGDQKKLIVSQADHRLAITVALPKDQEGRLLLRQPLVIPADIELSFVLATQEWGRALWILPLVRDANGREYLFHTKSKGSLSLVTANKGLYIGGRFCGGGLEAVSECRFTAPGLRRLDAPLPNFEPVKAGDPRPVAPLTMIGLQIKRNNEGSDADENRLYLRDFAWTCLNSQNTALHYQFDDEECFGELDGLPQLPIGDLGKWYGQSFDVSWDIRGQYEGQPFLAGGRHMQLDPNDKVTPYAVQRCQRVEFPVRQEGTYWVRVKLRWANGLTTPEVITEREYRLFVIKGEPAAGQTPLSETAPVGDSLIRVAPARKSLVWGANESLLVPVVFFPPPVAMADSTYHVRALSTRGQVLAEAQGKLDFPAGKPRTVSVDFAKLAPGAYRVEATVLSAGKMIDQTVRLVGKETPDAPADAVARIPDSVPSYQQILDGDRSMFHLDPYVNNSLVDDKTSRADVGRKFMDMAKGISHDLEWQLRWRDAEPLPGVYDFSEIDQLLDNAGERGFSVLLWAVLSEYPEWLPSLYTQNEHGEIFGHPFYLFHGAKLNLVQAPALREPALRFLRNLAAHCRSHPALQGYFYLLEHPGDAAFTGWYEGYDSYTLANFQADCRAKHQNIAEVNRRWGTSFADFRMIQAPRHDKPAGEPLNQSWGWPQQSVALPKGQKPADQYWLDWMRFQSGAIHQFLVDCAKTIRHEDPKRLIMVYCDGLIPDRLGEFRALGCMTANGGCADPQRGAPAYIRAAAEGVPQRAEEVSVFQWSGNSPTQLDASLFAMMMGGGGNAHCKAYIDVASCLRSPTGDLQVLRKPPFSLDRYERFMPIWNELRATVTQPSDIRYFEDFSSYLVESKTTYQGWDSDPWATMDLFESHLLFGVAPAPQWEKAKLLLLIRSHIEVLQRQTIEGLVKYVNDGGTLVMRADAGRRCVEEPNGDWTLLKRFGFAAPAGDRVDNQYTRAVTVAGGLLAADGGVFALREIWNAGEKQPGQADALFNGDPKRPAVSDKAVGKGRVVVVWASTIVPPSIGLGNDVGYPFLRQIAAKAGAVPSTDADTPHFWLNLLTHRSGQMYYGLVHCSVAPPAGQPVRSGTVRFWIPEGTYQVRELIAGKDLGQISAKELREQGIHTALAPDAVAVYRFALSAAK